MSAVWEARRVPGRTISLVALQDRDEHQRRRKPWNRAFSTASVKGYEEMLEFRVKQLVEELNKRAERRAKAGDKVTKGETVDLSGWLSHFS